MRRRTLVMVACAVVSLCCRRGDTPLEIMLPPWFSPDASHPSVQRVFEAYRRDNPGFSLRFGPGKADLLREKLLLMAKEKRLPDVVMFKAAWAKDLAARGVLVPLPPDLAHAVAADAVEFVRPVLSDGDTVWAIPYDTDVRLIHYRRDLVDAAGLPRPRIGWTLEEFLRLAQSLTRDSDGDGTADTWGFAAPGARSQSSVAQFLPWAWTMGARTEPDEGWRIDQPPMVATLRLYSLLRDSLGAAPRDLHVLEQADVFQGMVSGRFAMTEGGSWEIAMIRDASPFAAHIAQVPLPTIDGVEPLSCSDGWALGLTTNDPSRRTVAAPLLQALFSASHQREKLRDHGWLPVLQEGIDWVAEELGEEVAWSLRHSRSVPGGKGWTRAASAIMDAMQEVLAGGISPAVALRKAQGRLEMLGE